MATNGPRIQVLLIAEMRNSCIGLERVLKNTSIVETFKADCRMIHHKCCANATASEILIVVVNKYARRFEAVVT